LRAHDLPLRATDWPAAVELPLLAASTTALAWLLFDSRRVLPDDA
jgi:hypothetical protein